MEFGWNWITDRVALGGQFETPLDAKDLRDAGITHILNCREVADPDYVRNAFAYSEPQPARPDDGQPRTTPWFAAGRQFWEPVALSSQSKLYVHCHAGLNRSASMVYFLLRIMGLAGVDAKSLIIRHRWIDIVGIRYAEEADAAVKALGYT
jgi:hypothetical protein